VLNDWALALNNRHSINVAYIDYSEAFDTAVQTAAEVNRSVILLSSLGISGNLMKWTPSCITDRIQCIIEWEHLARELLN